MLLDTQDQVLWTSTRPGSMYGLELCVHVAGFDKEVNRAQERWGRLLLGITGPVARVTILDELGWTVRLATHYRGLAVMLWGRVAPGPSV